MSKKKGKRKNTYDKKIKQEHKNAAGSAVAENEAVTADNEKKEAEETTQKVKEASEEGKETLAEEKKEEALSVKGETEKKEESSSDNGESRKNVSESEEKKESEEKEEIKEQTEEKKTERKKEEKVKNSSQKETKKSFFDKLLFSDKRLEVHVVSKDAKNREVKKPIENKKVNLILEVSLIVFVALILISIFGIVRFMILENSIRDMNLQVEQLISEQESMVAVTEREKQELKDKISILTSQVAAQMVQNEEEALKHIPTALPVTGKVVIISEPGDLIPNEEEPGVTPDPAETQIVILGVNSDSKILASGSGVVKEVRADARFGYCIEVDHENEYTSLYYFNSEPKVKSGDEVLRGQLLYDVNANNGRMGYQIIYDGEYLNPVDVMEIKG